jgi:hypothetical protein
MPEPDDIASLQGRLRTHRQTLAHYRSVYHSPLHCGYINHLSLGEGLCRAAVSVSHRSVESLEDGCLGALRPQTVNSPRRLQPGAHKPLRQALYHRKRGFGAAQWRSLKRRHRRRPGKGHCEILVNPPRYQSQLPLFPRALKGRLQRWESAVAQHILVTGGTIAAIIGTQINKIESIDREVLAQDVAERVLAQLDTARQRVEAGGLGDAEVASGLKTARVHLARSVQKARAQFATLTASVAEQQQLPEGQRDATVIETGLSRAQKLLLGMAALGGIIADLAMTGGLITLATLSYAAGHTLAVAQPNRMHGYTLFVSQETDGACTCGRFA